MDLKLATAIGIVVVVAIIIGIYLAYPQSKPPAQTTITTPPSTKASKTTSPSTTTTTNQTTGKTISEATNATTTTTFKPKINVQAILKSEQPTPQQQREGVILVIHVSIQVSAKTPGIRVSRIYFDNLKPGTNNPLVEQLYLEYSPPHKLPLKEAWDVLITNDLPQETINSWKPGTTHTLTIIYVYNGIKYKDSIEVRIR